jgi:MFS family permease
MLADKMGTFRILIIDTVLIFFFGLAFKTLFVSGNLPLTTIFLSLGLLLMGFTYGPLGTALCNIFPTAVRYYGSSLTFTFAGILGASVAPYIATYLATSYGLEYAGYYLCGAALISLVALIFLKKHN